MTSTEFTIGFGNAERASSKVLKPPGGGSSDIFGTTSQNQAASQKADSTQNRLFGGTSNEPQTPASVKANRMKSTIFGDSQPQTGSPKLNARKFVTRNPITGEVSEINSTNGTEDEDIVQDNTVGSAVLENVATNGTGTNGVEIDNHEGDSEKSDVPDSTNKEQDPVTGGGDGAQTSRPVQPCIRIKNPPGGKSSGIF